MASAKRQLRGKTFTERAKECWQLLLREPGQLVVVDDREFFQLDYTGSLAALLNDRVAGLTDSQVSNLMTEMISLGLRERASKGRGPTTHLLKPKLGVKRGTESRPAPVPAVVASNTMATLEQLADADAASTAAAALKATDVQIAVKRLVGAGLTDASIATAQQVLAVLVPGCADIEELAALLTGIEQLKQKLGQSAA